MIGPNSRYAQVAVAILKTVDGPAIAYLRRRFAPQGERHTLLFEHEVTAGERLDQIAAENLGDPEQFWRIADANDAIDPYSLVEIGRRLRITLPEGIPAPRKDA